MRFLYCNHYFVSIQLISPASGDDFNSAELAIAILVSIQLISPASGDHRVSHLPAFVLSFPFN